MSLKEISQFLTKDQQDQMQRNQNNSCKKALQIIDKVEGFSFTYFTKPLIYAKEPYFCPNGWRRYSLDVGLSKKDFAEKYKDWPVCYHGTSSAAAYSIISTGFIPSNSGCWIKKQEKAVYLTPSIVYAGHPRYAKIEKLALQIRVKQGLFMKKPGTLKNANPKVQQNVDFNYKNDELQWVFLWNKTSLIKPKDGIIIYGIMAKICQQDPYKVKETNGIIGKEFEYKK